MKTMPARGSTVTFNVIGTLQGDGEVAIGCEAFTMAEVAASAKKVTIVGDRVDIKRASGTVSDDEGNITFPAAERSFSWEDIADEGTKHKVTVPGTVGQAGAVAAAPAAPNPANLRWQDGDMVIWTEPGHTGPRYRRDGVWYRHADGRRAGRRWTWTDARYDQMISRGKVRVLVKGGVDFR